MASALDGMSLRALNLAKCPVDDLTPLAGLPELRHLYIRGIAPGVDLAPLAGNRRLTVHIARGQDVRNRELLGRRVKVS